MMIIGFSTVNVAPATTGSRTPNNFEIPADWMIVAMPGHQQVGADEDRDVVRLQPDRRPDDQRHGDRARVHDEQVLQAEDEQPLRSEDLVDRVHLLCAARSFAHGLV